MSFEIDQEFQGLLLAVVDARLDQRQRRLLNARLRKDPSARAIYRDYLMVHELLEWDSAEAPPIDLNDAMVLPAMTGDEENPADRRGSDLNEAVLLRGIRPAGQEGTLDELAGLLPPPAASSAPAAPPQAKFSPRAWLTSLPRWRTAAAVLLATAGFLAIFAVVHHRSAATLVATVDAKWEQGEHIKGDAFAVGTTSRLISGFAELHFAAGATVLVEGPAEMAMRSDREIYVSAGKVFANVPGGGFVVSTPAATVTDLGTEFGVNVSAPDQCEVAVFKGKVQVDAKIPSQVETSPGKASSSTVLVEGQAVSVSAAGITGAPSSAISQQFTRTLESPVDALDMVDLVAGGDGTTHLRGRGIDPSGNWGALAPIGSVKSDGLYHRVTGLAAVDGVFIPKGIVSTQLDSAGNSFVFPMPLGLSHHQIWAGGVIPALGENILSTLDGTDYSAPEHGLIFLHSARGLTFDLNAIRRLHPDKHISGFRCLFGNTYRGPEVRKTDAWVFTDGHIQFSVHNSSNQEKPAPVSIAVKDSDHYLTLVTASPTVQDYAHSWIIAADPVLELESK